MTEYELRRNFKIELDKSGEIARYPSFLPEEIDYWINSYISRFIKSRTFGTNQYRAGFQQGEKRTDDLRMNTKSFNSIISLFKPNTQYNVGDIVYNSTVKSYWICTVQNSSATFDVTKFRLLSTEDNCITFNYPTDYWFGVGETVEIKSLTSTWPVLNGEPVKLSTDVIEATIENVDTKLSNSLSDHRLNVNKAKPIRVISDGTIKLFTDGQYFISRYVLQYISKPDTLDFYKYPEFSETIVYQIGDKVRLNGKHYICTALHNTGPLSLLHFKEIEITFMADHAWDEIIVGATKLALLNISDDKIQSYSSIAQEIE